MFMVKLASLHNDASGDSYGSMCYILILTFLLARKSCDRCLDKPRWT